MCHRIGSMTVHALSVEASKAQQDELWQLAIAGGTQIVYPQFEPALMKAWGGRALTDELAIALDASCSPCSVDPLFEALSPLQLAAIKRHRLAADAALTSERDVIIARRRRFYFFMRTAISAEEWATVERLDSSRLMEPGYTVMSLEYPGMRARLAAVSEAVRMWIEPELGVGYSLFSPGGAQNTALLWAATLTGPDDANMKPAVAQLNALERGFGSQTAREHTAKQLARVLVETTNPVATLAALRTTSKAKTVRDMYDRAEVRLAANLGPPLDFVAMEPTAAAAFLLDSGDGRRRIAEALIDADQARTFGVLLGAAHYLPGPYPDMLGADGWSWIKRILLQLDRTMRAPIEATPFVRAWTLIGAALTKSKYASAPMTEASLSNAMRELHDASTSPHFRALVASVLSPPDSPPAVSGPRMYSAAAKYSVGDKIRHSTFGEGTVTQSAAGKVHVQFSSSVRVLAQAR